MPQGAKLSGRGIVYSQESREQSRGRGTRVHRNRHGGGRQEDQQATVQPARHGEAVSKSRAVPSDRRLTAPRSYFVLQTSDFGLQTFHFRLGISDFRFSAPRAATTRARASAGVAASAVR